MKLAFFTPTAVTIVVEGIESGTLKIANGYYKIGTDVQTILNEANANALVGATIQAKVVKGEITNITSIELNTSGSEGALVTLDGGNTFFIGDLTINSDNVELKNLTIIGSIILTSNVTTRFVTKKVEVKGDLIVESGKMSPPATLFHIPSIPVLELSIVLLTSFITKLELNRAGVSINSNYPIFMMELTNNATQTQFNRDTKIELLIIPHDTNPPSFICNFNNVSKNIGRIIKPTNILDYYRQDKSAKGAVSGSWQIKAMETIEKAAESYWQEVDLAHAETETIEEYYVFMNQTLSLFQTVFEQNAEVAGFNMISYYNLSENRRKESLFDWLLLWNITIDDYSEIMKATEFNDRLTPLKEQSPINLSNTSEGMNVATIIYEFDEIIRTNCLH